MKPIVDRVNRIVEVEVEKWRQRQPANHSRLEELEREISNLVESLKKHNVPEIGYELDRLHKERKHLLAELKTTSNVKIPRLTVPQLLPAPMDPK